MHREKQILLGLLGLLCGGFVAVLGAKLFIPRPPAGAGPDIDAAVALAAPQLVVEPPTLSPPRDAPPTTVPDRYAGAAGFGARDAAVAPAAFVGETANEPADPRPVAAAVSANASAADADPPQRGAGPGANPLRDGVDPPAPPRPAGPPATVAPGIRSASPAAPSGPVPLRDTHVTVPGDTWWGLAERGYGDGRYYRALYAWNRALDPQVSLVPGTRLEIPSPGRLEAAWPRLVPPR